MTITQTYRLAHSARGKLSSEASRGDHDLRLLVGHANLLDSLMVELQDAENEQEAWFNETMKSSVTKSSEEPKHVQWKDEVINVLQQEASDEESDSDSEDEADDVITPLRKVRSPPAPVSTINYYGDEEEEDDDEYDEDSDNEFDNLELALVRTRSRSHHDMEDQSTPSDPPELVSDSSDESDDESSPPSTPPQQFSIDITEIHRQQGIKGQDFGSLQRKPEDALLEDGYFLPPREEQAPLIAVY